MQNNNINEIKKGNNKEKEEIKVYNKEIVKTKNK